MDSRFTITNMAIEMGAKAGIIEPDEKTYKWLKEHGAKSMGQRVKSDKDAIFKKVLEYLLEISPYLL